MSVLFNTTLHAAMNDISVTTGNADGWVLVVREPLDQPMRSATGPRRPKATKDKAKRPAKRKS